MDKYIFPSVFDPAEDGEVGYTVTFPDLPGCITEGDTIEEAMAMAREAMELWLWDAEQNGEAIPIPSLPQDIEVSNGTFLMFITAWMNDVRDEMANKAIKKTLTLPKWLNDEAERYHVNFSQVLQIALKERLGIIVSDPIDQSADNELQ
jgi:predicted RNase H-like HicB family nuclease